MNKQIVCHACNLILYLVYLTKLRQCNIRDVYKLLYIHEYNNLSVKSSSNSSGLH
jgi:hypothetical protein